MNIASFSFLCCAQVRKSTTGMRARPDGRHERKYSTAAKMRIPLCAAPRGSQDRFQALRAFATSLPRARSALALGMARENFPQAARAREC
jgi:hypothetical protein